MKRFIIHYISPLAIFLFSSAILHSDNSEYNVKNCLIIDSSKHASNQKLVQSIVNQELSTVSSKSPTEQANYLVSRISQIAQALLKNGFAMDAYGMPEADKRAALSFEQFVLWEGGSHEGGSIPLTLFAFVWPSEEFAMRYFSNASNSYHSSSIHSHPMSCAFTVLQGTLIQNTYEHIPSHPLPKVVKLIKEENFEKLAVCVDDLEQSFIHQLCGKGTDSSPIISFHMYGLPSEEQVTQVAQETAETHTYNNILQKDGTVTTLP